MTDSSVENDAKRAACKQWFIIELYSRIPKSILQYGSNSSEILPVNCKFIRDSTLILWQNSILGTCSSALCARKRDKNTDNFFYHSSSTFFKFN